MRAPGPRGGVPVRRFREDQAGLLMELRRTYGGVVRYRVGPYRVHQVTEPDLVRRVLKDNGENFTRGVFYDRFRLFFGEGLLTADGEAWRMRRAVAQPFFRHGVLHESVPLIAECVEDLRRRWAGPAAGGGPVDIVPEMMRLAMGVVGRVILGADPRPRAGDLVPAVAFAAPAMIPGAPGQLLPSWFPAPYPRRVRWSRRVIDAAMDEVIDAHSASRCPVTGRTADGPGDGPGDGPSVPVPGRDGGAGADRAGGVAEAGAGRAGGPEEGQVLAAALLDAVDPATGRPWTREQVRDELKTHFLAGHETTGCGLAWALYAVATHPRVRRRLVAEIDDVLAGRAPTADDLAKMPYLRQVVDESLRLHPPIPLFPRGAVRDVDLGGHLIPKGTSVFMLPYVAHHDPDSWEDPERFDPDRFDPSRPGPSRYTYFPFGGGVRRCIGSHLATLEIRVAVAMILQRYTLTPARPAEPRALLSLRPRDGMPMTIRPR
ncbi:cytochrome P450 [Bailinhaonella thermotolerans]|uniref:Cytochrome P450 n=1 Tax=Bailinhaonella thermotolerans TaxID=1070861 RepID=A0A3A4B116_9ACTN|nr:cytochrome P450 [Bailinhaonella thermotolerans]RJL31783.1 cytochrome P450 [Bailinhaonella thermotolerans]